MRVICNAKRWHSELVHSGHYWRYPGRFKCSKCGARVHPDRNGRKMMAHRWQSKNRLGTRN